ncbi:MAG: GIY-YIG nuclease family protein, partial [Gammaproteobacteria bacterium]|nr:GIY-YIG nuclease family protein [Gammaproteobacteria bacterium]
MVFSLYILRCTDDTLYTGIASDVRKRISEHETSARGAKYLRGKGPLRLEFAAQVGDRAVASMLEY